MWTWNGFAFLLIICLCISVRAHHDGSGHAHHESDSTGDKENGPILIKLPIGFTDQSDNSTSSTNSSMADPIALKLNCTKLKIKHTGYTKMDMKAVHGSMPLSSPVPDNPKHVEHREIESEWDNSTWNPANESTEKPAVKDDRVKSKRSTGYINPSKNVTVHDNYSNVKTYTAAEVEPTKKPETTEMSVAKECTAPFHDVGEHHHWYQILVENGGAPGDVNATRLTPNVTHVRNPCERPIKETVPPLGDLIYNYEMIEFEKMFRREKAFLRFAGTDSEFVDIRGVFAWSPPDFRRRYYVLEYRNDDTGFYVQVHKGQKCQFMPSPVMIKCSKPRNHCDCEDGEEVCTGWRGLDPSVAFSLIGG